MIVRSQGGIHLAKDLHDFRVVAIVKRLTETRDSNSVRWEPQKRIDFILIDKPNRYTQTHTHTRTFIIYVYKQRNIVPLYIMMNTCVPQNTNFQFLH